MRRVVGLSIALCLGACGSNDDKPKPEEKTQRQSSSGDSGAVLSGRVRLAEGAELPRYGQQDMVRQVLRTGTGGQLPEGCKPSEVYDRTPVRLTADGSLSGLVVMASDFSEAPSRPPKTHKVAIEACRLAPPTIVAVVGDKLELRNKVAYPFMPTFGPSQGARTLMPGQTFHIDLDHAGIESVLCTLTAPCGRTDVVTVYHPLYDVTDEAGRFQLDHLPVDEPVTINAWHPLFEPTAVEVSVGVGQEQEVELVIRPRVRFEGNAQAPEARTDLSQTPLGRSVPDP